MFDVGDVVKLKSGGPAMTIYHIHDPNNAAQIDKLIRGQPGVKPGTLLVVYFDSNNKEVKSFFSPEVIEKYKSQSSA